MKKIQKGFVVGLLCVSMAASGLCISSAGHEWKQTKAMAKVTDRINVWYGRDIVTNKTAAGQPIVLSNETADVVEGAASETAVSVCSEGAVIVLNNENFEEQVHQMKGKLVIDVSATWCGPCQKMKPYYEQLAKEYEGQVRFASIDGDKYLSLITDCAIWAYPTLLFYEDGKLLSTNVGSLSYEQLEALIRESFKLDAQVVTGPAIEATERPVVTNTPIATKVPDVTETPKATKTPVEKISVGKAVIKKAVRTSKSKIKVTVKRVNKADGYKIVYADNSKFKKKKTVFMKSTSKVLTGLKKKKTYYIKAYAYKKASQGKKIYGKVSTVKRVK